MAEQDLIVTCKNCSQDIHYLRIPEKGMGYIECPKCKCSIDQEGNVVAKPAVADNIKEEINKLLTEHQQIHASFELDDSDNYYDFQSRYDQHERIIKDLESRNEYHKCQEDFLDDYHRFNKQEIINDNTIDLTELLTYFKSFKLKDPFMFISKDNSLIINTTKEEFEKTHFLKVAVWKTLRLIPRRYWSAFKFLSDQNNQTDNIDERKPICELNCLRIDTTSKAFESAYNANNDFIKAALNVKRDVLEQAQTSKANDKIELNKFFLHLTTGEQAGKETNLIVSDFIEEDFPIYVRKNIIGIECEIHKDGDSISVYSIDGLNLTEQIPNIIKDIKKLSTDGLVMLGTLELLDTQTNIVDLIAYLKTDNKDNNIICNIYDILYSDKDIHNLDFSERKKYLDLINFKQSSFEINNISNRLNKTPYIVCKKRFELEKAIGRLSFTKNYAGVVIRIDTPYSLVYQQPGVHTYNNTIIKCKDSCESKTFNEALILCDFLNCEIKDIYINVMRIPHVESGNIFNAIEELTKKFTLVETRNFSSYEIPPIYQEIRLKKNLSKTYLIEGTRFYYDDAKNMPLVVQIYPVWGGYQARFITHVNESEFNISLHKSIKGYAFENNFLRNEKFSVSGDFLDDQTITWDDLKLSSSVKDKLKKLESLIVKNDPTLDSRGLIFIGPPGCGKTLTGKLLAKMAPTFIWVTAKDCSEMGTSYAFSTAFSLARDLRPTILFMEDIDSHIEYGMIDLLKTELDGMKLNNGVFTILTSNFPEKLPEALIDRPGRFHDIIYFTLPNQDIRKEMLLHFLKENIDDSTLDEIIKQTDGFSGAHIKEICRFAQIIQKEDNLTLAQSLIKSLDKLIEQRNLINDLKNKSKEAKGVS